MEKRKSNILKGSIIALLCLVLVAGVVLSALQPGRPGTQPDNDQLSSQGPTPNENPAPDAPPAPPTGTEPSEPRPEPRPTEPKPTQPAPTEPTASEPEVTEPQEPESNVTILTGNVSVENMTVMEDASFSDGNVSVKIPAGVQLNENTSSLTLTITEKDRSDSGVQLDAGQTMLPLDVHIDGISAGNTAPITVSLGTILPKGLNIGNYSLYHVENGVANKMNAVYTLDNLSTHNDFLYNPANGNVSVCVASFSEIAFVSEPAVWKGNCDTTWYENNLDETKFEIFNADQLEGLRQLVDSGVTFEDKTVTLCMDVTLSDGNRSDTTSLSFDPIGYGYDYQDDGRAFMGTFDGNGNTISNLYQNGWALGYSYSTAGGGLFASVCNATIKNLTMDNAYIVMECIDMGTVVGYAQGNCTFENIVVRNSTLANYQRYTGGAIGEVSNGHHVLKNVDVEATTTVGTLWGDFDASVGGIIGGKWGHNNTSAVGLNDHKVSVYMEKCDSAAKLDVYNDVTSAYQWYSYRRAGMLIGHTEESMKVNGRTEATATFLEAKECTVQYGNWVNYHYCEFGNTTSLSARYPWVRVEEGNFNGAYSNPRYGVPKFNDQTLNVETHTEDDGCHIDGDGHNVCIVLNQLYGGGQGCYGGNSHLGNGVTVIGQDGNPVVSAPKFESTGVITVSTNSTVKLGDLFKAVNGAEIQSAYVYAFVSPANATDTVRGTTASPKADTKWQDLTITFTGTGTAKIVISDYYYCEPTVIYIKVEQAKKFTVNSIAPQNAYSQITLGDLFDVNNGAAIGNVTATVTNPNGTSTVTGTSADWATQTIDLTKDGTWTVAIKDDSASSAEVITTFTVNKVDKFTNKFSGNFLYRVGNASTTPVSLSSIFSEIKTDLPISSVDIAIETIEGNATGTFTSNADWTNGKIQFTGTGVVKLTISAEGANPVTLHLEVVDATNLTSASGTTTGGNLVLLCDVNTATYVNYWNCTLFGNGFTYSLNGAPTTYSSSHGHGVIITKNATLDNLVIIGDVYDEYGAYTDNNDYNAAIDILGDTVIQNCYISGCSAPISTRANATITNTTLYGGAVANLLIKGGTITLENVTTANYNDGRLDNGYPVGMGIVVHSDASETAKLVLNGTLTQYNFLNEKDTPTDTYAKQLHSAMFDTTMIKYHFGTSPRYVNTGIISLTATFNAEDIADNANTGYSGSSVTLSGINGYVYTQLNTSGSVNNGYDMETDSHVATTQSAVPPSYSFDYTSKNYVGKTDGSNDYCYLENGVVQISMDFGDTFDWDTSILTVNKLGSDLDYTVKMNDVDYTGKSITFSEPGYYDVIYSYTDPNNYSLDANGNIITYSQTYKKTVKIYVAVIKPTTKHAEFTFGSSNQAVEQITVNNMTYLSATNKTADGTSWGCMTVGTSKIYYPIVEAEIVQTKASSIISTNAEVQAYFYVFDGTITIKDYENGGAGNPVTYDSSTTTMPSGLTVVKGKYGAVSSNTTWYSSFNDSSLSETGAQKVFKYAGSNDVSSTPTTRSNKLCYASDSGLSTKNRSEYYTLAQYSYTDNAGTTYYYYVGYHMQDSKNVAPDYSSGSSGCFAEGTLITLADGTQKPIEQITYEDELLAWDFHTGAYAVTTASLIESHKADEYRVINLKFADGTVTRVIVDHGFFDVAANNFVFIDESNVASYVGHEFVKVSENGAYESVELVGYEVTVETVSYYTIQTAIYNNCIAEGMFTLTSPPEMLDNDAWFDYFEIGEDMKYDEEKMQADIEKYGLYTYEDFAEYVTYEQFIAFNGPYLKVLVGRGVITYEQIIELIATYVTA